MVLKIRIVWPAFFSIGGAVVLVSYAIAVLGFFSLARPVYDQHLSFSEALPYLAIGISGLAGAGLSIALLLDEARHRLWGILVLVPYGAASYYYITAINWPVLCCLASIPLPGWFWPLAYALLLGLAGAIGGIFWKPRVARPEPRASSNKNLRDRR
jgi:hypothetical protein